ncbi:C40 family peptidase [uncultured Jatrophihabitans sp.]|uniref:C40 family peptidase n=1 Tax=uncultured Jatrophihabitans sp. TaxID=1610747 RepID=UPI0035CA1BF3
MPPISALRCRAADHPRSSLPRRTATVLTGVLGCAAAAAVVAAPAHATTSPAYVGGHDPIGTVSSVKFVGNTVQVTGWAADLDARTSNAHLLGIVDGRAHSGAAVTSLRNATATKKYRLGATPGFTMTMPVPTGNHTVCVTVVNVGRGLRSLLRCIAAPHGRSLTSRQIAARSPKGTVTGVSATSNSIRMTGTAYDPDYVYRHSVVVAYVDDRAAATVHVGDKSAYDITVPASRGSHVACLWAVNVGWGHNTLLGCRAVDTRGAAGSGAVKQPTLNKQVLAEAKKHIGQRYVWGATGPKTFDCSGLVMYSYHKYGYTTPRVAAAQFHAARLIPKSRAVPGDLVFYSDNRGDVYHVGMYSGPGMSVAAIDTQEGVNWQRIYSYGTTFFGSFTHT